MPAIVTPADADARLAAPATEALLLQKPALADMLVLLDRDLA